MTNLKERNILLVILFSIISFGIYFIYLFFALSSEIKNESERLNIPTKIIHPFLAFLLALVTFGIYGIYYIFKVSTAVKEIGMKNNVSTTEPIIVLILNLFFGIGYFIVSYDASKCAKFSK